MKERKGRRQNGHRRQDVRRVEFRLLGPFELLIDEQSVDIGPPKLRVLLAALLLHVGRPVLVDQLAELLWGDEQPHSPRRGVQLYVTRLRGILATLAPEVAIDSYSSSYQLNVERDQIDLCRFTKHLRRVAEAAEQGNLDGEATALTDALAQWRGEPLVGIPSDRLEQEFAPHLREQWLQAAERRFDVELRRGRHAELISDLMVWTARHQLRERLWGQLVTALHRSGRRSDALEAYHTVRRSLADELGVDPGEDLLHLYAKVLAGGPQLATDSLASLLPVPRQLPADVLGFVGRVEELAQLDSLLANQHRRSTSTIVSVIAGTAGIGKTALAVHWARAVADRFPDGQLWVNLRGFDLGRPVTADQALTRILRALRGPETEIPLDLEDKIGLYRSLMDGRRMLVVLDNATSSTQVLPLLPGAPGSLVLITSRSKLSGLVATAAAHPVVLDLMSHAEACQLLARRVGTDRVQAAPVALREIIDLCARLPLALSIVAARAAASPSFVLDALAADLRAAHGTLDAFASSDSPTEIRAAFSWSYRSVSSAAGRIFRLLGLHPGPDLTIAAVASLAGLSVAQTQPLLVELTDAYLVTETTPGRYTFHDLMRAYATELGLTEDSTSARQEAQRRMIDHYLNAVHETAETLPAAESIGPVPATIWAGIKVEDFEDHRQALL